MAQLSGKILVGTASWSDPGFVEHWYPKGMVAADRLAWYALHFETVEVNSTFYSVPDLRMVDRWCRTTPEQFTFDVKLHQILSRHATAEKMLPPALRKHAQTDGKGKVKLTPELEQEMLDEFLGSIEILRAHKKLGILLLQLSPAFSPKKHDIEELTSIIDRLKNYSIAIELRNRNWVEGDHAKKCSNFCARILLRWCR